MTVFRLASYQTENHWKSPQGSRNMILQDTLNAIRWLLRDSFVIRQWLHGEFSLVSMCYLRNSLLYFSTIVLWGIKTFHNFRWITEILESYCRFFICTTVQEITRGGGGIGDHSFFRKFREDFVSENRQEIVMISGMNTIFHNSKHFEMLDNQSLTY